MAVEDDLEKARGEIVTLNRNIAEARASLDEKLQLSIAKEVADRATKAEDMLKKELYRTYLPAMYVVAAVLLSGIVVWAAVQIKDINASMTSLYKDTASARKEMDQSRESLQKQTLEAEAARTRLTSLEKEWTDLKKQVSAELDRLRAANSAPKN